MARAVNRLMALLAVITAIVVMSCGIVGVTAAPSAAGTTATGYVYDGLTHTAPLYAAGAPSVESTAGRTSMGPPGPLRWSSRRPPSVVAAEGGSRVFWSGGQAAKNAAADYALANGSKTLEMTAVGRALERIPRGPIADRISKPLWDLASAGFAATARGEAHVFIGSEFRGGASVFGRIEGPILNLKGNPILQHFGDVF